MTKRKKTPRPKVIDSELDETVARLLQTDPKELEDALAKVRRKRAEVERDAKEIKEEFEKGPARKGRFPSMIFCTTMHAASALFWPSSIPKVKKSK